jgi:nucleoside-diphosphate-sugar epimerase
MSTDQILIVGGYGVVGSRIARQLAADFPNVVDELRQQRIVGPRAEYHWATGFGASAKLSLCRPYISRHSLSIRNAAR